MEIQMSLIAFKKRYWIRFLQSANAKPLWPVTGTQLPLHGVHQQTSVDILLTKYPVYICVKIKFTQNNIKSIPFFIHRTLPQLRRLVKKAQTKRSYFTNVLYRRILAKLYLTQKTSKLLCDVITTLLRLKNFRGRELYVCGLKFTQTIVFLIFNILFSVLNIFSVQLILLIHECVVVL